MIVKTEREHIFNHGWVESYKLVDYDFKKDDDELIKIVAGTIYQKESDSFKDIDKLKGRLLTEAAVNTPSRVYEFIPRIIKLHESKLDFTLLHFLKYSNVCRDDNTLYCYTNARNVYKNGYELKEMESLNEQSYKDFFIVKMFIPMFIRDQFMTHTQLSKLNRSYRVSSQNENKYWLPKELENNSDLLIRWRDAQERFNNKDIDIDELSANVEFQEWVKKLGLPKEIWTRFGTQNRYGEMIMAGWLNDPNGWINFFLERGCVPGAWNNWVQRETKAVANVIYKQSRIN